jgi:LEA14-like dessication related protein
MTRKYLSLSIHKISVLVLSTVLLSACSGMRPGYETPGVSVQSFRAVPSTTGAGLPSFEIGLQVTNPNLELLELAGISYTVSLDGQDVIKGVGNDLPVIEGYGEGTFTVTAAFNLMAGVQLVRSLMSKSGDTFDYAFEAKLDPGAFKRKIRVRDSGTISLAGAE